MTEENLTPQEASAAATPEAVAPAPAPAPTAPQPAAAPQAAPAPAPQQVYAAPQAQQAYAAPAVDYSDHTAEFSAEDIAENKLWAASCYLFSFLGMIVAALLGKDSAFTKFHIKEAMKLNILSVLVWVVATALAWTFIVPIAAGILLIVLTVIAIIATFNTLKGQARQLPLIKSIGFLN